MSLALVCDIAVWLIFCSSCLLFLNVDFDTVEKERVCLYILYSFSLSNPALDKSKGEAAWMAVSKY